MAQSYFHIGQRLTDFSNVDLTVEREASGGFGVVAMGPDQQNAGQWSALKILRPDLLTYQSEEARQRLRNLFLREALTWCGLWSHPNLLTAQFVTEIDGQLMLVLDYAEQGNLRDRFDDMRRQGTWLTISSALLLAQQIAAGLVALHTPAPDLMRNDPIVHRDLKPENILMDQNGFAMITDFGLAKAVAEALALAAPTVGADSEHHHSYGRQDRYAGDSYVTFALPDSAPSTGPVASSRTQSYHTRRGQALGTPAYMAPEQWVNAAMAERPADAYAFGVILAELLTRWHPLLDLEQRHSLEEWRTAHTNGHPIPLETLGADEFTAQRARLSDARARAGFDAALLLIERLLARLLAKLPDARPTLDVALAELQTATQALGEKPYLPPDISTRAPDQESLFWQSWAVAYYRFERPVEALPRIERAYQLAPHDPAVLTAFGNILVGLGRLEESLGRYQEALERRPPDHHQARSITLTQLGSALHRLYRFAEADQAYTEALDLTPDNAATWCNRALNQRAWAQGAAEVAKWDAVYEHLTLGLEYIERAVRLNPNNPRYIETLRDLRELLSHLPNAGHW